MPCLNNVFVLTLHLTRLSTLRPPGPVPCLSRSWGVCVCVCGWPHANCHEQLRAIHASHGRGRALPPVRWMFDFYCAVSGGQRNLGIWATSQTIQHMLKHPRTTCKAMCHSHAKPASEGLCCTEGPCRNLPALELAKGKRVGPHPQQLKQNIDYEPCSCNKQTQ